MTRFFPGRFPLLLLGTGSAAAYMASSLMVTGHIPRSTVSRRLVAVQRRDEAEVRRIQRMEATNAAAQQTVAAAASRLQAARSTVLSLQQQLASLQNRIGAGGSGTTARVATALPPAPPVASAPPVVTPPPVVSMPLPHTTTGASGAP